MTDLTWRRRGACVDRNPELFFHPEGERGATRRHRANAAKTICGRCPVTDECRRYALDNDLRYGTWGGTTEAERARLVTGQRSSRPRTGRTAPNRIPPETEQMILLLHRRGHPKKRIARLCQVAGATVQRVIAEESARLEVAS